MVCVDFGQSPTSGRDTVLKGFVDEEEAQEMIKEMEAHGDAQKTDGKVRTGCKFW